MKEIFKLIGLCILFLNCTETPQDNGQLSEDKLVINDKPRQSLAELYNQHIIQYKNIVDSINQSLNEKYGYDYNVIAFRKSFDAQEIFKLIPYFGMSDGKEAFLYSLHLKDLWEVKFKILLGNTYLGNNKNGTFFYVEIIEGD